MDGELRKAIRSGDHDRAWRIRHRGARPLLLPVSSVPDGIVMPLQCAHTIALGRPSLPDASETDMRLSDFLTLMLTQGCTIDLSIVDTETGETLTADRLERPRS